MASRGCLYDVSIFGSFLGREKYFFGELRVPVRLFGMQPKELLNRPTHTRNINQHETEESLWFEQYYVFKAVSIIFKQIFKNYNSLERVNEISSTF